MMKEKVQKAFNGQINAELYSAYLYLSMAAYFESNNLKGFGQWMRVQAKEETAHAMKFYDHIIERGGDVSLKAIDAPKAEWKSAHEAFQDAYKHELKVTGMINANLELAALEKDHAAESFLKWFVDEQVEEEAQTLEISEKLKLINNIPGGLIMLDHHYGKRGSKD
jgi:ferritin